MMDLRERIIADPQICQGRPCIKGTRIMVTVVLDNLASGMSTDSLLTAYPSLSASDIQAAIAYAASLADERVVPLPARCALALGMTSVEWKRCSQMSPEQGLVQTIPLAYDVDGVLRVGGTRVTFDVIISAFLDGATAEEIAQQYPSVSLADLYSVIGYYLSHGTDVEQYLAKRRQEAASVHRANEQQLPPEGIRARLLTRR